MKLLALALLPLLACASEPVSPLEGTQRLRRQYVTAEGGARQLLHLVDTETGEPCDFNTAEQLGAAGTCVPAGWGSIIFLDDACARPVVEAYATSHAWVAVLGKADAPDRLEKLVRLGALIPEPTALWRAGPDGCRPDVSRSVPVYAIAEEMPRDRIATGVFVERATGSGPVAHVFEGQDGSRLITDLVDPTSKAPCRAGPSAAGPRCVPEQSAINSEGLYDERCERLAYPNFLGGPVAVVSDLGSATYRFGDRIFGTTVTLARRGARGECTPERREIAAFGALHFGVPYPPSEWPNLALTTEGGPRLTASVATLPDGTRAFDRPATFDDRGQACTPIWVRDALRCLPLPLYARGAYADPACTRPVALFTADEVVPASVTVTEEPSIAAVGNLLPTGRVRALGRELAQAYLPTRTVEGCSLAPRDRFRFFEYGDDVAPERFAELALIKE